MKFKVTVRLSKTHPGAFLMRHELRELQVEADTHSEILKRAFTQLLESEPLEELFGMDIYTYSQDEEGQGEDVTIDHVREMLGGININ